jgi:hypothetical protein
MMAGDAKMKKKLIKKIVFFFFCTEGFLFIGSEHDG